MRITIAALAFALVSGQTLAYEAGDWIFRGGVGGTMSRTGGDAIGGDDIAFSDHVRPSLGISYMLFDDWGIGASAIWTHGQNLYLEDGGSRRLGSTRNTPVTVAVEYYLPKVSQGRFWLLAGWHYMRLSGEEYRASAVPGFDDIELADGSGFIGGFGVDWDTGSAWSLSTSVLASTASVDVTLRGSGGEQEYEAEPEPLIWQLGLSRRF